MLRQLACLVLISAAAPAAAEERSFMLSGFDRIRVEGPFEVTVTTGGSAAARAEGESRAIDGVSVRLSGSTLVVSKNVNGWNDSGRAVASAPRVTVSVPELRGAATIGGGRLLITRMRGARVDVSLTGSGTIDVAEIDAEALSAKLLGTGAIRLAGRALDARVETNGAGTIDAEGLTAVSLLVNAQSAGDSRFTAQREARIIALGQGSVTVGGGATCQVDGPGPVDCEGALNR